MRWNSLLFFINKINAFNIQELTTGTNNWSLSEVVHAIVLLSHFHSLSSFVFSCGLTQELENTSSQNQNQNSHSTVPQQQQQQQHVEKTDEPAQLPQIPELIEVSHPLSSSPKSKSRNSQKNHARLIFHFVNCSFVLPHFLDSNNKLDASIDLGVDALMARMKNLSEKSPVCNETELSNRFKSVEQQVTSFELTPIWKLILLTEPNDLFIQAVELSAENVPDVPQNISHLVDDPTFTYQDFQRRGAAVSIPTFRIQDYSWDDHGYSLVNRLYSDVGNLLDVKFRAAYNLTYFTMADRTNVDTSKFRRAIWNYIQCIYGW